MAHVHKPDFVFRRNGRVRLNRRGASVQTTTGSRGVRTNGSNAGYTMFRDNVKSTGYPLHSPVSASLPLRCVTVCHHISAGVYQLYTIGCRGQLKCDGTRAETRFRLSARRTSPFKSAGSSVQSTAGSRSVRISGSNAGYTNILRCVIPVVSVQ